MRIVLAAFAIVLAMASAATAEEIREIQVDENTKTTSDTVMVIAKLEVGDDWNNDMIETVKARLVSSGLFSDVTVFSEPAKEGGGVKVTILVHDKHSWVIAPAIYRQPSNTGAGVGYGENNLFGKNQKLLIYGQIATGDSFFVGAWVVPHINGTRFYTQIDTLLKSSRNIEYAAPTHYLNTDPEAGANRAIRESRINYLNGGIKLGIELFRGFKLDTRLRGAHVTYPDKDVKYIGGGDADQQAADLGQAPGEAIKAPGAEGWDISNEWTLTLDRRANWYGIQTGYKYAASFETSALSSDFHYFLAGIGIYNAQKIMDRHNLVLRSRIDYGFHLPFQQEYATGGTSMRGWLNNQFRGDFKASANLEYSFPLFTAFGLSIRGLGFWDSAYTTFLTTSNPDRNYLPNSRRDQNVANSTFQTEFAPFKNSVGVGTRFYLQQIVLPLLGLDIGYGLEARDYQIYLAIGLTD